MVAEVDMPRTESPVAMVFAAVELSFNTWLIGIGTPDSRTVSRHQVKGGDLRELISVLNRAAKQEEVRCGRSAHVHVCFEAGRDGHWLWRALTAEGFTVSEIDAASVAVNRRQRRAKTDRLDVEQLVRVQAALARGDRSVCSVVHVPTPEDEDAKRLHRERERLVRERTSHVNRIKALLYTQGVREFEPTRRDRLKRLVELRTWNGTPLPARLRAELERECRRLALVIEMIAEVETERNALIDEASPAPTAMQEKMVVLAKLKGVGPGIASVLASEVYYRNFRNRRELGQYVGLAPSPYASGDRSRDQGISKAGNARARTVLLEGAWMWLRYQSDSALSKWFRSRVGDTRGRVKRIAIVALARKLAIALWRYVETGLVPEGAILKA